MARYRDKLPQLEGRLFLTDGGIETTLVFHQGLDLPHFAAFDLFGRPGGEEALADYFGKYTAIARQFGTGLILESATWRANPDWAARLGYSQDALAAANRRAIGHLESMRSAVESDKTPVVLSGCVGPRGDGYNPSDTMTAAEAETYHQQQIATFAGTEADMIAAITMNYVDEAIGIARAAKQAGLPAAISFTVETDGSLPTGQPLSEAIERVDEATAGYPAYYMINCAHPTHFAHLLESGAAPLNRIRALRANASRKSHAELDESTELDTGDPEAFGREHAHLKRNHAPLCVLGGCCGTDHRHVEQVAAACAPLFDA